MKSTTIRQFKKEIEAMAMERSIFKRMMEIRMKRIVNIYFWLGVLTGSALIVLMQVLKMLVK